MELNWTCIKLMTKLSGSFSEIFCYHTTLVNMDMQCVWLVEYCGSFQFQRISKF